jgi:hypothetical protein
MNLQSTRLRLVNVMMHSSPAMPASVTHVPSKMSSRNAVQCPLQLDDAHVSHHRAHRPQFLQCTAACQRSHIVDRGSVS